MTTTIGDEFPKLIQYARMLQHEYQQIPTGRFALLHIDPLIEQAEAAWTDQDTTAMVRLYPQLQALK